MHLALVTWLPDDRQAGTSDEAVEAFPLRTAPWGAAQSWQLSFAVDLPPLLATGRWRERGRRRWHPGTSATQGPYPDVMARRLWRSAKLTIIAVLLLGLCLWPAALAIERTAITHLP